MVSKLSPLISAPGELDELLEILDALPQPVCRSGPDLRLRYVNTACARLLGIPRELLVGRPFPLHMREGERSALAARLRELGPGRPSQRRLQSLTRPDGRGASVEWTDRVCLGPAGEHRGYLSIGHELTSPEMLLERLPDALLIVQGEQIVFANAAAARLWRARDAGHLLGRPTVELIADDSQAALARHVTRLEEDGILAADEMTIRCLDGEQRHVEVASVLIEYRGGSAAQLSLRDITARREAQRVVEHLAFHDPLTGLANRARFSDELARACARARREGRRVAVVMLDLDGFKAVNDRLGHVMGDQVLVEVARRLAACTRRHELVARLGGDEFAIVASNLARAQDCARLAERVLAAIAEPPLLGEHDLRCTVSIGGTVHPDDPSPPEQLVANADAALYAAKADGGGCWRLFDGVLQERVRERQALGAELVAAVEAQSLSLLLEPIVDLATDRIVALEAIPCWRHPERGEIRCRELAALAEEGRLLAPLAAQVMQRALRLLRMLDGAGHAGLRIVMSASPGIGRIRALGESIARASAETGLEPGRLVIRLEEATLADGFVAGQLLPSLRTLGVGIGIDDLGSGPLPLARLADLPVTDARLLSLWRRARAGSSRDEALARSAIRLAQGLGHRITVAGVESRRERDMLHKLGCHLIQGPLMGPPVPDEDHGLLRRLARGSEAVIP